MNKEFEALLNQAADPAFREQVEDANKNFNAQRKQHRDVYLACFNTPAGRAVLEDLYNRYVNVSRCVPGEAEGSGFYREGAAQVIFDITATIEAAAIGDTEDGEGTD